MQIAPRSDAEARGKKANAELADILESAGWKVMLEPRDHAHGHPDMIVRRGRTTYVVEVKAAAEGRSDRLIPLWSQAYLQAGRAAGKHVPLAVVAAPRIAPRAADQILAFIADVAPSAAAGVFDFAGLRRFRGPHLEELDSFSDVDRNSGQSAHETGHNWPSLWSSDVQPVHHSPADIFSDLNQWMLKVLLASEIPEHLLSAPREHYRDASHLARSAGVSAMSASRLVRQLDHEGYLDASHSYMRLVRRRELFSRWQASSHRRVKEVPMRFLLRGDPRVELRKIMKRGPAALGLFAAAKELRLGFVHGVPPYVYVPRLTADSLAVLKGLVPTQPGEEPDVMVRQAPATQSVFRGLVRPDGLPVTDILQVWLDVASHPSRGEEQADFIRRRALAKMIDGENDG